MAAGLRDTYPEYEKCSGTGMRWKERGLGVVTN